MTSGIGGYIRAAFEPPRFLDFPYSGIDLSTSGVKVARLEKSPHGFILASYAQSRMPTGAYMNGDIVDHAGLVEAVRTACKKADISAANAALPESKSYLFETTVPGSKKSEWRTSVEQNIDEFVPLPPPDIAFDIVPTGRDQNNNTLVAGVGFAKRIVSDTLSIYDDAGIRIRALEDEVFAIARALLPTGDESVTLIIDVGKTTTKISIVEKRIPRFATTVGIGGHALTLAVQKHFGVTEMEARKVKSERGIVPASGNEDYLAAMLSSVAAIRDEISLRLNYWQSRATGSGAHKPVERAILAGGNASVRGLPEYLEGALQIPVTAGDVFTNLASRDVWLPSLDYTESLAYATAIGLALYDEDKSYA